MFRFFFIRFVLPLIAFLVIRAVVKAIWGSLNKPGGAPTTNNEPPQGGELMKDPVCGTYVAAGSSVTRKVDGEILHFCSASCRDQYKSG